MTPAADTNRSGRCCTQVDAESALYQVMDATDIVAELCKLGITVVGPGAAAGRVILPRHCVR
jgi:hypothetical protein